MDYTKQFSFFFLPLLFADVIYALWSMKMETA